MVTPIVIKLTLKDLGKTDSVLLTDDYVPVDNMVAPLFATR